MVLPRQSIFGHRLSRHFSIAEFGSLEVHLHQYLNLAEDSGAFHICIVDRSMIQRHLEV